MYIVTGIQICGVYMYILNICIYIYVYVYVYDEDINLMFLHIILFSKIYKLTKAIFIE